MRPFKIPKDEIKFAAKAGFFTKELWVKHFTNHHRSWIFKRWRDFIQRGIFIPFGTSTNQTVVRLNRDSSIVKSVVGGDISSPPSPYQIRHDSMVMDIVLKLVHRSCFDRYFFEPEIKRDPKAFGIRWEKKFPDAIIHTSEGCFAIEVELSRKSPRRYDRILNFYAYKNQFDEVLYYSNSPRVQKSIAAAMKRMLYPMEDTPIVFRDIIA